MLYVWTKKAEDRAKELNLKDMDKRKEGMDAYYGYVPVDGGIAVAWLESGYIRES